MAFLLIFDLIQYTWVCSTISHTLAWFNEYQWLIHFLRLGIDFTKAMFILHIWLYSPLVCNETDTATEEEAYAYVNGHKKAIVSLVLKSKYMSMYYSSGQNLARPIGQCTGSHFKARKHHLCCMCLAVKKCFTCFSSFCKLLRQ